jgi:hypothetical protein
MFGHVAALARVTETGIRINIRHIPIAIPVSLTIDVFFDNFQYLTLVAITVYTDILNVPACAR